MDPEGPWTLEMVETMLGQALVIETKWKMAAHEAVLSAIGAAFSKNTTGETYLKALQAVIDRVRGADAGTRPAPQISDKDLQDLRRAFRGGKSRRKK